MKLFVFTLLVISANAIVTLDNTNFEKITNQKVSMVLFQSPWCDTCQIIEKDLATWVTNFVVGTVDCVKQAGLCSKMNVHEFPTLKYSNGYIWKKYEDSKTAHAIDRFLHHVEVPCFKNTTFCTIQEHEMLNRLHSMNKEELYNMLSQLKHEKEVLNDRYTQKTTEIRKQYVEVMEKKDKDTEKLENDEQFIKYVLSKL